MTTDHFSPKAPTDDSVPDLELALTFAFLNRLAIASTPIARKVDKKYRNACTTLILWSSPSNVQDEGCGCLAREVLSHFP
jgi:hypothetical protein